MTNLYFLLLPKQQVKNCGTPKTAFFNVVLSKSSKFGIMRALDQILEDYSEVDAEVLLHLLNLYNILDTLWSKMISSYITSKRLKDLVRRRSIEKVQQNLRLVRCLLTEFCLSFRRDERIYLVFFVYKEWERSADSSFLPVEIILSFLLQWLFARKRFFFPYSARSKSLLHVTYFFFLKIWHFFALVQLYKDFVLLVLFRCILG